MSWPGLQYLMASLCSAIAFYLGLLGVLDAGLPGGGEIAVVVGRVIDGICAGASAADLFDRSRVGGKGVDQIANRLGIDVSQRLVVSALTGRELALGRRRVRKLIPIPVRLLLSKLGEVGKTVLHVFVLLLVEQHGVRT
jgi:hypothetical protein